MDNFVSLVTDVGLPVAVMIVLAWFCYTMYKEQQQNTTEQLKLLQQQNHERETLYFNQLSNFQSTLDKLQQTLEKIDVRLEYLERKQREPA